MYVTYQTVNDVYTKRFKTGTEARKFYSICKSLGFKVLSYRFN